MCGKRPVPSLTGTSEVPRMRPGKREKEGSAGCLRFSLSGHNSSGVGESLLDKKIMWALLCEQGMHKEPSSPRAKRARRENHGVNSTVTTTSLDAERVVGRGGSPPSSPRKKSVNLSRCHDGARRWCDGVSEL